MNCSSRGMISVIIPVYNGEKYIAETVKTISASDYKNLEIIVVNDGSSDKSGDICKKLSENDLRIKYIYQKNGGIVAARNRGLQEATGEYICFCDQDDKVDSKIYSMMQQKMEEDVSELCMCGTAKFYEEETYNYELFADACYQGKEIQKQLLQSLFYSNLMDESKRIKINASIWKCLIKRKVILKYGLQFKRFINYEDDWIFLIELLVYCNSVSTIKEVGYFWRTNLESESHADKYVFNIREKQAALINYLKDVFLKKMNRESVEALVAAKECMDIIKLFENEASKNSPHSFFEKVKYIKENVETMYNKNIEVLSFKFAKGCIRYKAIYYFVRKKKYAIAYCANVLLQKIIWLLHMIKIGNKIESIVKKSV